MDAQIMSSGVPSGAVILWTGALATIPTGWVRCDGNNGTEDMTDVLIMGVGSTYIEGSAGGSTTHTHVANQSGHSHSIAEGDSIAEGADLSDETDSQDPAITVTTVSHIPPYKAFYWIMKT